MARPRKQKPVDPFQGSPQAVKELEEVKKWNTRVERARKLRTDWENEFKVEECERFFLGKQFADGITDNVYNHFRATIRTIMPSLVLENPKFFVRPKPGVTPPNNELQAAQGEGLLDKVSKQDAHLNKESRFALLQAFFRVGVLKVIYDPKEVDNPRAGEPIMESGQDGQPIIDDLTGEPKPVMTISREIVKEPKTILTDEVYRWEWIDAKHMLFPSAGPNMRKWPWIGEEVTVPLEVAQEDTRFPKEKRDRLKANVSKRVNQQHQSRVTTSIEPDDVDPMLKYIEVYDLLHRRWKIWAEGQDEGLGFLVDDTLPEGIESHPYSVLAFQPIIAPDPLSWPYPETRDWLNPQSDYNTMRKMQVEGTRRATRKFGYEEGTFSDEDEALKALKSSTDMEAFKVNDLNKMPKAMENPSVTADSWRNLPILQTDWQMITGQTGARLSDPDANSATEAVFSERASNLRDADLQLLVNQFLSEAGRKMFQLIKKTLTLDLWVRMVDVADRDLNAYLESVFNLSPEILDGIPGLRASIKNTLGNLRWQQVTREDLEFEAEVEVVPGSTKPRNLDEERKQWLEFLTILGQAPQLAMSRELLRETASKFEHINERMIDELVALAEKMNAIQLQKAGRDQGGENAAGNGQLPPQVQQLAQSLGQGG